MQNRISLVAFLMVMAAVVMACGRGETPGSAAKGSAKSEAKEAGPGVIATTLPLYDFARTIGGDDFTVSLLPSPEIGPHSYSASLKDRERLESAALVVANGLQLEEWLDQPLVDHLTKKGVAVLKTGDQVPQGELRTYGDFAWGTGAESAHHHHDHGDGEPCPVCGGHHHGPYDAHVWLSLAGAKYQIASIRIAMVKLKPALAETLAKRAAALERELEAVYSEGVAQLAPHKGRKLITFHDAWGYFAKETGVQIAAVVMPTPGVDGSLKHRTELENLIRSGEVSAIFVEPQYDPGVAKQISAATGAPTFVLDTAEATRKPLAEFRLVDVIRSNMQELKRALDQTGKKRVEAGAATADAR